MNCEGWRRRGGMMTLGPVSWEQCKEEAVVMLTIKQDGKRQKWPACLTCWLEGLSTSGIKIVDASPLDIEKESTEKA